MASCFRYIARSFSAASVPESLWKLGRLNHVAIATPDLAKAASLYKNILGAEISEPQQLPEHGVTTVFVNLGNTKLELLHPLGDKSPIQVRLKAQSTNMSNHSWKPILFQSYLDKNKSGGLHHICIEVDNIYNAMKEVKAKGIRCLSEEPRIGAHNKPVVFLHPKDCAGVLVELEQAWQNFRFASVTRCMVVTTVKM